MARPPSQFTVARRPLLSNEMQLEDLGEGLSFLRELQSLTTEVVQLRFGPEKESQEARRVEQEDRWSLGRR